MKTAITPLPEWGPARNKDRIAAGYDPIPGWGKIPKKHDKKYYKNGDEMGQDNEGFYDVELAEKIVNGATLNTDENTAGTDKGEL